MTIGIRRLTDNGLAAMRQEIERLSDKRYQFKGSQGTPLTEDSLEPLRQMVLNDEITEPLETLRELDPAKTFSNRFQMGAYLSDIITDERHFNDAGLWAWLTLVYLTQVLAKNKDGMFLLAREYRYIPNDGRLRYYRHLLRMAWLIHRQYDERARLFLSIECYKHTDFVEQSQKSDMLSNPNIIDLCLYLYYDEKKRKLKPGTAASVKKAASYRRLVSIVSRQLYMNYDLFEMTWDRIQSVLPAEFDRWKPKPST